MGAHSSTPKSKHRPKVKEKDRKLSLEVEENISGSSQKEAPPSTSSPLEATRGLHQGEWRGDLKNSDSINANDIEFTPSPLMIRQAKISELKDNRPSVSNEEKQLILDTWRIIEEHTANLGFQMFTSLFETYPDTKGAFSIFRALSQDDAQFEMELRMHGTRVMTTVREVLERIDDLDGVVEHLHELGRKHVIFNAKADYIDLIGPQFLFAIEPLLGEHWTPEVESAWANLFKVMGYIMREAMIL
uniref:Globin gb_IIIB n=1 Tax=Platynereis dumerilii TaxID=6359 RepID=A0A7T8CM36_PLADU|nr:globin gb_IIIB [Platynereis dumerilii]